MSHDSLGFFLHLDRLTLETTGVLEPRRSALEEDFEEEEEKEEEEPPTSDAEKVFRSSCHCLLKFLADLLLHRIIIGEGVLEGIERDTETEIETEIEIEIGGVMIINYTGMMNSISC